MNKELKEAKRLRKFIKEMERKNQSITYDYNYDFLQDLETVLNYIDNSIPKEVILDKIRERQFELQQEYIDFKDDIKLNTLQDLLEEIEN